MPRGLSLMPASMSVVVAVLMLLVVGASPTYTVGPGSPNGVPADVDCAIRAHAYEYGKQLLPRFGSFVTLFDALQLAENCNKERPKETTVKAPIYFAVPGTTSIYVDAKRGSDRASGLELSEPLQTIEAAIEMARKLLKSTKAVNVNLRAGTHYLKSTIHLGPDMSGVTIQNFNGERAVVSGGVPLNVGAWSVHKQDSYWDVTHAANNVYGQAISRGNTSTIKYLGDFDDAAGCQAAASKNPTILSYTYHEKAFAGDFARQCFGRTDVVWAYTKQEDVESGFFVRRNVWKTTIGKDVNITEIPGLRIDGRRAIRAKYPNGDPESSGNWLKGYNAGMGGGDYTRGYIPLSAGSEWVPPARKPDAEEVVITANDWPGVEWPMAEAGGSSWTGEGDWGAFHAGWKGYCDDITPPFGYWCAMNPPRGQCWDKQTNQGSGCTQTHMSPDGLVFPRAAARNYSQPVGAVLQAWRGGGRWFTQMWTVDGWDAATNTLHFDPKSGFQGGEGMTTAGQYWIENVLEELDSSNEYYFDESTRTLYYQPNSTTAAPPRADFVATKHRVLFNISGVSMESPVRGIKIRGLTLRDARYTYLDEHGMPSGGDWALQRSGAVFIESAESVSIEGNEFTRVDGNGLSINGYVRNLTVHKNDFNWIGDSAMASWGHTSKCLNANCSKNLPAKVGPDGRGGEQPRGSIITANLIGNRTIPKAVIGVVSGDYRTNGASK